MQTVTTEEEKEQQKVPTPPTSRAARKKKPRRANGYAPKRMQVARKEGRVLRGPLPREQYLTTREAKEYTGHSGWWLDSERWRGHLHQYYESGRGRPYYSRAELDQVLAMVKREEEEKARGPQYKHIADVVRATGWTRAHVRHLLLRGEFGRVVERGETGDVVRIPSPSGKRHDYLIHSSAYDSFFSSLEARHQEREGGGQTP